MSTLRSAGFHTVQSFSGTNVIQVDDTDVTIVQDYILLIDVKDYISYDASKVKVAREPNTTLAVAFAG